MPRAHHGPIPVVSSIRSRGILSGRVLSREGVLWLAVFATILSCWWALFAMILSDDMMSMPGALMEMDGGLMRMPGTAVFLPLFGMWAVMATAMMLPTFVPTLRTFLDLGRAGATTPLTAGGLVVGYVGVWVGASAVGAMAQLALIRSDLVTGSGASLHAPLTAGLLAIAGLYQFTRAKAVCLAACRMPLTFFMQRWRPGVPRAIRMGASSGLFCIACCWAQMALAFVGGTMNLWWMGLATLFMTVEKLPAPGRRITRPAGWLLLAAGAAVAVVPLIRT